ncbi:MAG: universal stress protein [Pseudomonadales bacterium]|nr:universal stress protein [Pseudomonadales bacterium]
MVEIKKALVVVDPTVERDFVVNRAKLVAKATGAELHLFINNENTLGEHSYIYEGIDGKFFETQRKLFTEHFEKILQELVEEFTADGIKAYSQFTENHHLAESIIETAKQISPDLVIKSTHHHSALERGVITNTDWRLIRKCPFPLMLVKPQHWKEEGCIATAIDPMHVKAEQSKLDHVLLNGAAAMGKTFGQPVKVFHSYYPFVSALFPLGGETEEHLQRIENQHRSKVLAVMDGHDIPEDALELSRGELNSSLLAFLNRTQANLLVLGALSRNFLERAIVGNTAEKILEDCPCDILVLKS